MPNSSEVDAKQTENTADNQSDRQLLFISHANPEDNAAASWFATQLTLLGYDVWCDVTHTHGGESEFWLKVQKKIENEAAKFVFILSESSRDFEKKKGVYKEVQAADNLGRDNFILPLRITKLNGTLPIQIGPDIYINAENWMAGLTALCERLEHDGVPKASQPNYERIASWWPALNAKNALVRHEEASIVSNVLSFKSLPKQIHFLNVTADKNVLAGKTQLAGVLGKAIPFYPYGEYAISFGCAHDFLELSNGYEIEDEIVLPTADFLKFGHAPLAIEQQTAQNVLTYLIANAVEHHFQLLGLSSKAISRSPRKIWFPHEGLIEKNRHSFAEKDMRKSPVQFVGRTGKKRVRVWHFGVQPIIDLRTHQGVILSPKAIITKPYDFDKGQKPYPIDDKKAQKSLNWWNKEWRKKVLGFVSWLAQGGSDIRIRAGYQEIILEPEPQDYTSGTCYREIGDRDLMNELIGDQP